MDKKSSLIVGLAEYIDEQIIPAGWRQIGRGRSRVALLGPDGRVYKVPANSSLEADGMRDNRREARLFAEAEGRSFSPGAVELLQVEDAYGDVIPVLRMAYVQDDGSEVDNLEEMFGWMAERGILDLNGSNWHARNGQAILIDAAGV